MPAGGLARGLFAETTEWLRAIQVALGCVAVLLLGVLAAGHAVGRVQCSRA